jgi:prefoldin subunit 5
MARTKAGLENKFDARIAYLQKQIEVLQEELETVQKHKLEFADFKDKYEFYRNIEGAEEAISPIVKTRKARTNAGVTKAAIIATKGSSGSGNG